MTGPQRHLPRADHTDLRTPRDQTSAGRVIVLPDAALRDGLGKEDICHVCVRAALYAGHQWTWLACRPCRSIDAQVAEVLGGQRFLPLGRHSIMNGSSVSAAAPPLLAQAQMDGLLATFASWQTLWAWGREEAARIAATSGFSAHGALGWDTWTIAAPPSTASSRDAYRRLINQHYPWLPATDRDIEEILTDGRI